MSDPRLWQTEIRPLVLGSGANAYGLIRALAGAGIRPLAAFYGRGPVSFSRLPSQRWITPPPQEGIKTARILGRRLRRLGSEAFLIPTDEPWVHLLNRYREELGPQAYPAISGPAVVELVLSKSAMYAWCRTHGVAQPLARTFRPGQDWTAFMAWARDQLPVIIKPETKGLGDEDLAFSTAEFLSRSELEAWGEAWSPAGTPCPVLAQCFISTPGQKLVAWHGYRSPEGELFMAGITKLRSRPPRLGGCTTAARFGADPVSRDLARDLLERLDYSGFFDLEFLVEREEKPPWFIELNPRPGNPNFAACAMGLNLPLLALTGLQGRLAARGRSVSDCPGGVWVDLSCDPLLAIWGKTSRGERVTPGRWLQSLRPGPVVDAYCNPRDPWVFPAACLRLGGLGLARMGGNFLASLPNKPRSAVPGRGDWGARLGLRMHSFKEQARNIGLVPMAWASLVTRFRRKLVFFQQDLRKPLPPLPGAPPLSWRKLGPGEEYLLQAINPAVDLNDANQRLDRGERGWVFFLKGQPVHYRWEVKGATFLEYLGTNLVLGAKEILHEATFTRRNFRRRGIATLARAVLTARSRELGYHRMITSAAWWNYPSLRDFQKASLLEPLGSAVSWRLGPLSHLLTSGDLVRDHKGDLRVNLPQLGQRRPASGPCF